MRTERSYKDTFMRQRSEYSTKLKAQEGKDVFVRMVQAASDDFITKQREAMSTSPLLAELTVIIVVHTDLRSEEELAWALDLRAKGRALILRIDATNEARAARGWVPDEQDTSYLETYMDDKQSVSLPYCTIISLVYSLALVC
jgi:hypothetical protein